MEHYQAQFIVLENGMWREGTDLVDLEGQSEDAANMELIRRIDSGELYTSLVCDWQVILKK